MEPTTLPTVAIVGRPNVGKSTLFNRIVGRREALVDDRPGVTRDRLEANAEWIGTHFRLVDTGGFEAETTDGLAGRVREQSLRAAEEADVVLLVVDGRAGIAPADAEAARVLARTGRNVLCVVNKIDGPAQEPLVFEFYDLGLGEPVPVSSETGRRLDELLDRIIAFLPRAEAAAEHPATRLAIVGRPNVGKSSILNRLVGEDRTIVDDAAGTTRDAIDAAFEANGRRWVIVDTAGVRRRSRIDDTLERASVGRTLRALDRADVVLLVLDAVEGPTDQDARLARLAWERGKGLLLVVNKWDLVPGERRDPEERRRELRDLYAHLENVPAVFVSALRGTHMDDVLPAAERVDAAYRTRIPTRALNETLEAAMAARETPLVRGKRARVYYATATGTAPPTVTLFVNDPRLLKTDTLRYLENRIRAAFPLVGTPLRVRLRARPRASRSRRPGEPQKRRARAGR